MEVVYYKVRKGDTVFAILESIYGKQQFHANKGNIVGHLTDLNPKVKDINTIYYGDILALPDPKSLHAGTAGQIAAGEKAALGQMATDLSGLDPVTVDLIRLFDITGSVGNDFISAARKQVGQATPSLQSMVRNYEAYKTGGLTRGSYDYQRALRLGEHSRKLGYMEKLVYPTRPKNEILRIDTRKGAVPTARIKAGINQASRVKFLTRTGNVVFLGAGMGVACSQIAVADSQKEKNLILVDYATVTAVGIGLMLAVTPVGWVSLVAIGVAGAATGMAAGWGAKKLYDQYGNDLDLASMTGVSKVCTVGNISKVLP